jgi:hypothetical protein
MVRVRRRVGTVARGEARLCWAARSKSSTV